MKRSFTILGVFILLLILSGWAYKNDEAAKALGQGNKHYEAANYEEALRSYEAGLENNPEDKVLNYNAAQAAYILGEYEKASEYYKKAEDKIGKFLNSGNIYFMAGEAVEESEQKAQCYMQALQIYQEGIIKFPEEVALKYNYELVKERLEEIEKEQESEDGESKEGSQSEESNGEESESGEDSEQEGQEDSENEESQGQGSEGEEDRNEESESSQGSTGDQDEETDGQEYKDSYSQDEEAVQEKEAIERILQMLENQEEQSLKNNQEIVGDRNEEKYGW